MSSTTTMVATKATFTWTRLAYKQILHTLSKSLRPRGILETKITLSENGNYEPSTCILKMIVISLIL